jgi:two-component system, NarL family, response regulator DegU
MIRIGIAEDHQLVRKGFIQIINDFDGIELVVEAENGKNLLDQLGSKEVDVILMDLNMPVMDGFEATKRLVKSHPNVKVIGLTQNSASQFIVHFMKAGGKGFLLKNCYEEELHQAIVEAHEHGYYHSELVAKAMYQGLNAGYKMSIHFPDCPFSEIELDVLNLICQGKSSEEIAAELTKSKRTIENHRTNMMNKVNAKNVVDLVMISLQKGFIEIDHLNPM